MRAAVLALLAIPAALIALSFGFAGAMCGWAVLFPQTLKGGRA